MVTFSVTITNIPTEKRFSAVKRCIKIIVPVVLICCLLTGFAPVALAGDLFITTTHARFRTSASTNAEVIRTLAPGTSVEVLEHDPAGWSRVRSGDTTGYIRSDLLTMPASSFPATFRTTDGVNLRRSPSTDGEVIRRISTGSAVEVLEHDPANWSLVRFEGSEGYVRSDYLLRRVQRSSNAASTTGDSNTTSTASATQNTSSSSSAAVVMWTTEGVNLRAGQSTDTEVIRTVPGGTAVSVLNFNPSGWSRVNVSGSIGYIRSDFLRPSTSSVELLAWSSVKPLMTNGVPYQIIDVRTGTTFRLQPFSKGNHADVETPTRADTDILLRLYGGVNSWTPRPVWVVINGRMIAAAIHNMPHSVSTISDNGLNGHLCLHFYGSSTHNGNASYTRQMQTAVMEAYSASR